MWTKDGVEYNFNDAVNSNITLTAIWTKNKYLVVFDFNEGTLNGEPMVEQEVYWREQALNPGTPYRDETSGFIYEFAVYTLSKNGNEFFNFDTEITEKL